jgi:signal transduction histidine kinase
VTQPWRDRLALWNWRSSLVSAALVGMVIVSALGAWSVRQSWLEHQRAVEATLDEYAMYAARSFLQAVVTENNVLRERTMAAVTGASAYPDDRLTLPRFAASVSRILDPRLDYARDRKRGFFRIDERTGEYAAVGAPDDSTSRRIIVEAVNSRRAVLDTSRLPMQALLPIDGERTSVHFALQRTAARQPVAVYGFTVTWRESFGPMVAGILERIPLLPPSLIGDGISTGAVLPPGARTQRMDTLVAIRMVEPTGQVYYESPRQFSSSASGILPVRSAVAPTNVHATLHPHLATSLRREMLNDERRRLQLTLAVLSALFAIAAILHIRRERELVRARRDFVASVSHELRTPLAQIRMFSETLLLHREDDEEERHRWLGIISREARRLGDLVENILLFSHIDAARVRLEPERTDLGELVEEVVEAYVPIAAGRQMRIVADAPSRIFAVVDPRAMRQVVVNLIDNALKYGAAGQTITVDVERNGTTALVSVSDQGPGVPAADRERLWRPFVRLANGGSTAGGSGIGLSVVRSLVHQHGGSVAVEDVPGEGSGARFVVTLPLAGEQLRPFAPNGASLPR